MRPKEVAATKNRKASEASELAFLADCFRFHLRALPRWTAVDAGANIGNWTEAFLGYGFANVVSFEPVGFNFSALRQRFDGDRRVHAHQLALFNRRTNASAVTPGRSRASTAFYINPDSAGGIQAIALDSMHWETLDLLKLDLEGAELRALKGAARTIEERRPAIIVEVIDKHLARFKDTSQDLEAWLRERGYRHVAKQEPNWLYMAEEKC